MYGLLTILIFVWLWHAKFQSGPNVSEAVGYDLLSIGLPLAILIFICRQFLKSYRLRQSGSGIGILMFILSAAALVCKGWIIAVLFALVGVGIVIGMRQHARS
jgi:hypothetical protein